MLLPGPNVTSSLSFLLLWNPSGHLNREIKNGFWSENMNDCPVFIFGHFWSSKIPPHQWSKVLKLELSLLHEAKNSMLKSCEGRISGRKSLFCFTWTSQVECFGVVHVGWWMNVIEPFQAIHKKNQTVKYFTGNPRTRFSFSLCFFLMHVFCCLCVSANLINDFPAINDLIVSIFLNDFFVQEDVRSKWGFN